MTNSQRLAMIRAHLRRWLQENSTPSRSAQGTPDDGQAVSDTSIDATDEESVAAEDVQQAPESDTKILSESILIRDGFYTGRTFELSGCDQSYRATWFMEPDELKIHDAGGELTAVFSGDEIIGDEIGSESSDDSQSAEVRPISIPMPAAAESLPAEPSPAEPLPAEPLPAASADSEDDDQISKAA